MEPETIWRSSAATGDVVVAGDVVVVAGDVVVVAGDVVVAPCVVVTGAAGTRATVVVGCIVEVDTGFWVVVVAAFVVTVAAVVTEGAAVTEGADVTEATVLVVAAVVELVEVAAVVIVAGGGAPTRRNGLLAVFQCVERYEPAGGAVL